MIQGCLQRYGMLSVSKNNRGGDKNILTKEGTFTSPQSSEQFVWLNRRYGETETQLSPSAIMPSTRADSSQNAVI